MFKKSLYVFLFLSLVLTVGVSVAVSSQLMSPEDLD